MAPVSLVSTAAKADAVVVGVLQGPDGPVLAPGAEVLGEQLCTALGQALLVLDATGTPGDVHKIATLGTADAPLVLATGLGAAPVTAEAARRAAGSALRSLTTRVRVTIAIDAPAGALAEGALLGAYEFTAYRSAVRKPALRTIGICTPAGRAGTPAGNAAAGSGPAAARAELRHARVVADAVNLVRDLVNTPANDLYPETFAARAAALAGEHGLESEVLDEQALARGGYGGILGVGQGSARQPRLVQLRYRPARAKAHVALVGKGITFDSGGLNLKTAMLPVMKSDMGGGAAVLAATIALAQLKAPVSVTATVPMAENMVSGSSYRPSDVLTLRDGSTVEVTDTDAEGRLILADGLTRAVEDDPDRLIEISTLTGAQLNALGMRVIGAMGTPDWRDAVVAAANDAGESTWAMPLPDELLAMLDSPVADRLNLPDDRTAGMLVAGRFLGEFVPAGLPWVHLDIAGPAFNPRAARDYTPRGGTGAGVRAIIAAVQAFARA